MAFSKATTVRLRRPPLRFVVVVLYPRTARFTYAPGLWRPRGVLLSIAGSATFLFVMVSWVIPAAQRRVETDEREREALRTALGGEPAAEEFYRRLAEARRERRRLP
jgi:hypothetical protein